MNAEKMLFLSSEEGAAVPYRERKSYSGTTRGEILGPVIAQSWEESLMYSCSMKPWDNA